MSSMSVKILKMLEASIPIMLAEVATYAAISTTHTTPADKNRVIVTADENFEGKRTLYAYDLATTAWIFVGVVAELPMEIYFTEQRNLFLTTKDRNHIKFGDILPYPDLNTLQVENPALRFKLYMLNNGDIYYYTGTKYKMITGAGGTKTQNWRSTVETFAALSTVTDPLGMDAVIVTADETHNNNKTWYLHDGYQWNYKGPYYKQEAQEFTSLSDTRADIIVGELDLGFDYIVGENELDLYIDGNHSNYLLKEVGDLGFTSTKVSFDIDVPIHVNLVIRKVVSRVDDEPHTNPEVYVGAFKSNYDAIERFAKYQKSNVITYDTFTDAQNDPLLVKEGQVILTLGHVTKNDGKGRYWILESTDKDFAYKNKDNTLFINRLISSMEKQPGEIVVIAGSEVAPPETVEMSGQIANRTDFKRVWAWAAANGRVVTEAEVVNNPGCFSSGDLTDTFRFPLAKDFIRAKESGRNVGSFQDDAIRNITGQFGIGDGLTAYPSATGANGAFATIYTGHTYVSTQNPETRTYGVSLDTSRVVPTATENRPKNIMQKFFIKI